MCELKEEKNALLVFLDSVEDPRKKRGVRYSLAEVLYILVFAACASCTCCADILAYAKVNETYFLKNLKLKQIPSQATFYRIIQLVDYFSFAKQLNTWLITNFPIIAKKYFGKTVSHLDGKSPRGATAKSMGGKPNYFINFLQEGETISLFFLPVGEKTNERGSLVKALDMFDLSNSLVTIDAAGTTSEVIDKLKEKDARFLLQVKDGNRQLVRTIDDRVKQLKKKGEWEGLDRYETSEKDHGRIETVSMTMISDTTFIPDGCGFDDHKVDIARVGIMHKKVQRMENGEYVTSESTTYLITDEPEVTAEALTRFKQTHWNIEAQHYIMDVRMKEDMCTARKDNASQNMSILRRFSMAIKERNPVMKKMKPREMPYFFGTAENVEKVLFTQAVEEMGS